MIPILRAWILSQPDRSVGPYDMTIDETDVDEMAEHLEEAMVGWMGPGGDSAFIEMFGVANQVSDLPITNTHASPADPEELAEYIRPLLMASATRKYMFLHGDRPDIGDIDSDSFLRRHAFGELSSFLNARVAYVGRLSFTILDTPRNRIGKPMKQKVWLSVKPKSDFRAAMMGELAQPWEMPEPPWNGLYLPPASQR